MMAELPSLWRNIIANADCYKNSHWRMYPQGTSHVSSYLESRGGRYPVTLFVGLQAFIIDYLLHPLSAKDVDEAEEVLRAMSIPINRQNWLDLINDHNGYLPVEIEAVPEGTVLPTGNVLLQVVNTDPKYPWLTGFIETAILRAVWYPTTVGTVSWTAKQFLREAFERTSDHPELLRLYLHDYGARGVSSFESAALGGMAHLVNFDQTDTVPAYLAARRFYDDTRPVNGASAFQEHSVIIAAGRQREADTYRALLADAGAGVAGLLVDAYDHENAVRNIVSKELHKEVASYPGLVIIRCDSGDPVMTPVDTIEWLMEAFETTTNSKGFKLLPANLRVVQGDGLTPLTHAEIYKEMERRGFAADNLLCGMGGGLLQQVNRDTLNFGYKANAIKMNGEWIGIQKTPTGSKMKRSKAERLALQYSDGDYRTVPRKSIPETENLLVPVFRDGKLLKKWNFLELIERSERPTPAYYAGGTASGSSN
jgi:nicotinamide phosphoribosyltransferase